MEAVIEASSSGLTESNSIFALNGSPIPESTLSLPRPAANTEIGNNAMHNATDIRFNFVLCTIPPLIY